MCSYLAQLKLSKLAISQLYSPVILTLVMFCVSQFCESVPAKVFYLC